jgi:hypothetical protein
VVGFKDLLSGRKVSALKSRESHKRRLRADAYVGLVFLGRLPNLVLVSKVDFAIFIDRRDCL